MKKEVDYRFGKYFPQILLKRCLNFLVLVLCCQSWCFSSYFMVFLLFTFFRATFFSFYSYLLLVLEANCKHLCNKVRTFVLASSHNKHGHFPLVLLGAACQFRPLFVLPAQSMHKLKFEFYLYTFCASYFPPKIHIAGKVQRAYVHLKSDFVSKRCMS